MATLKSWRLLRKLRCSTNRMTNVVKAVLVLLNLPLDHGRLETGILRFQRK